MTMDFMFFPHPMTVSLPAASRRPAPPVPPTPATPAMSVGIAWDDSLLARNESVRVEAVVDNRGKLALTDARSGVAFGKDTKLRADDPVQRNIAEYFLGLVEKNRAALGKLESNFPMDAAYDPGTRTFDLRIDRPEGQDDLRYVGLMDAMPDPVRELLDGAREVRDHF